MEELEWEIYAAHRIKVDEGNLNISVMGTGIQHPICTQVVIVTTERQTGPRASPSRNSDSASNYVDRVRIRDSSNSFGGPGRGSGWRQKSLSNIDLPTSYRGIAGGGGGGGVGGITGGGLGAGQFRYRDYDSGLYDLYSRIDSRREEYEDLYGVNPKAARAGSAVGGRVATSEAGPGAAPSPSGGKANGGKKRNHHRSQEAVASSEHAAGAGHQHHHHHHHHHHAAATSGGASQQQQQQTQFYNPDSNEACSLRRTRSLAVIREESYNDIHLPGGRGGSRRSQLIPRAKLTDRNFFKERFSYIYDDSVDSPTKPADGGDAAYSLARRFSSAPQQQSPASNSNGGQQPPFPWHTDKSDLDSIDSSIFKHSLHQQSSFEGSRRNSVRSDSNQFVSKVEVHSEYSGGGGGGGGGGSTKSDTGVDADLRHLEDLSLRDESSSRRTVTSKTSTLETIKRRSSGSGSTGAGTRAAVKYGGVKEEDESGITIIEIRDSQVSHKSSSVISYDSIYLSSESDEKDHPEDDGPGPGEAGEAAAGRPAVGDVRYEDYDNLFHETDLENAESTIDTLYGQVTKPKPKPKIVGVEPKVSHSQNDSLRRYIKHTGRSTLERLSLISNLKLRQEFSGTGGDQQQQSNRDRPAPGLKEKHPVDQCDYQYNSLPDADVCKLLRHSERIDAKLRRIADTGDGDHSAGRPREGFGDSLPRLHRADLVALTQPPSDEDLSLEESDKGAPSIELVETPTKEVASSSKVYLQELGVELDYENSVVTGQSDPESDITIVAPQDDLDVPTPAIVITPPAQQQQKRIGGAPPTSKKQYSTFASTAGKQTTNRIHYARKEPSKPNPEALREVRTKLKPIPVPPPPVESGPKVPLALAPTVKLGGKKVIVDEVAAKAAKREKQLEPAVKKEPGEGSRPQEPIPIAGVKDAPEPKQEGSPKVDHSSLFKETNPFKEQARREIKNRINDERPLFKGVRRFNSTENIYTSSPIIVTKTFNNCIKTNEVKTKSFDSLIVDHSGAKMPRPQVIQIVDSKHHQQQQLANGADTVRKTSKNGQQTQREFLHKVDSVRNYWSKMLDEVDQQQLDEPDTKNDLRAQELSGSKNGNAERKASIGSATSEASDSSKHTTSTKAASSTEGNIVRPAAVTSSREKYSTYQLLDDEDGEDDLHCQSFSPTVEIIELDGHKQAALVKPKNAKDLDFDHVRYKVMKSEMFQKNLLVNHRKAAQFDGLMQYLQDYSFQELLAHNNVVIIEPVRTKIEKISDRTGGVGGAGRSELPAGMCRITNGALQAASVAAAGKRLQHTVGGASVGLKKHFFYHPIRVNKELLDEELPSPDTVRNVRKLFEGTLRLGTAAKQAYEEAKANGTAAVGIRKWDSASLSSGVSSSGDLSSPCDCGEAGEHGTPPAAVAAGAVAHHHSTEVLGGPETAVAAADGGQTDLLLHESHYVSQDVLEKIRECGSTVTYYGGRVLDKRTEHISTMTRAIMREIRGQDRKCGVCQPHNCVDIGDHDHDPDDDDDDDDEYGDDEDSAHRMCPSSRRLERSGERDGGLGVKFKLVKSNSCSSRLELAGTGKTPPDLLRPNGRMRGRHHIPEENGSGSGSGSPIEEPEESVRDMVSRLESSGTLAPRSKPRIIESKCIEKGESPTVDITINSQTTLDGVAADHGDPGAVTPVTVNNHINHVHHGAPPPPPPLVIPPLLKAPGKVDQPPVVAAAITSMERPTKVCRNKNVDLAFAATMRQIATVNGTGKSASSVRKSSSLVAIGASEDGTSPPDSAPHSASSVTKTVTFNFTNSTTPQPPVNGSVENGAPPPPQQQQPLPVVDQSENLRPSAIAEQRKADELTSPKLVNWSTIGRFDERQYFANDRKLIEKRKYDDMEFEEFEVLDPNAPPSSEHYDSLNSK